MTQLTAKQATKIDKMCPRSKELEIGTRLRAVEGGTIATGTEAQLPVCGADGVPAPQTVSGDATINASGVVTVTHVTASGTPTYALDLDASAPTTADIRLSNSVRINNPTANALWLGVADADIKYMPGELTTRNNAGSSMYVPVTDSSGHERLWKIAAAPAANGGGYFETLFVNTKVAASMAGILRGAEFKTSVTGTANASGEVVGSYDKVNVETGATAASVILHDIELDVEGSGTVTAATGLRVKDSAKITYAIDVSGTSYTGGAVRLPAGSQAGKTRALLTTAFGCAYNSAGTALVGVHKDTADSDKRYAMFKDGTDFYYVQLTAVGA